MGRLVADALAGDGWRVVVHATDAERAAAAAAELAESTGSVVHGLGANLREPAEITQFAARASELCDGRIDLLVNSAATFEHVEWWEDVDLEHWAQAMDVNVRAPYFLTQALLPSLVEARGCVVNVSDVAAHEHWTNYPVHSASKAALESLTISGARALGREGVRVNAVVPKTILPPDDWSDERIEQERANGRLQSPQLLVGAICALAADPGRTGQIIRL